MSLEHARSLLLHDKLAEAEVALAEVAKGEGAEARWALVERGRLALRRGEAERALEWFREGWTRDTTDEADAIARAGAARHLGELLERLGEFIQAETVLREAAEVRLEATDDTDREYGALIVSLAAVLLAVEKRGEAKMLAELGARSLWEQGDERAVEALLVRAMAMKATGGRHSEALEPVYALPPEVQDALIREAVVGQRHRAKLLLPVLVELNHWHKAQRELSHPQILALIAEISRDLGRKREWIAALEDLAGYFLRAREPEMHRHSMVALARAHQAAGKPEKGAALLVEAAQVSEAPSALLREAGMLTEDADLLKQAIERGDEEEAARAHTALGVLMVHNKLCGAEDHLREGSRLPGMDADSQLARLHLIAHTEGASCGCGEAAGAMSRALQDALFEGGPADLIHVAGVIGLPTGLELRLELTREPTSAERMFVDNTVAAVRRRFERS
ncbi:MAG: hypothetical protein KC912_00410 [Proteobacteria bacterium]|nr:hypothetical protein [Pseudomonadota bacterium]